MKVPFSTAFPEYTGRSSFDDASNFLSEYIRENYKYPSNPVYMQ
jgi:hypothetical protein